MEKPWEDDETEEEQKLFFFFNREGKKQEITISEGHSWFAPVHDLVSLVILAGLLKVILRKDTETSRISFPYHPRGPRLMPTMGLC